MYIYIGWNWGFSSTSTLFVRVFRACVERVGKTYTHTHAQNIILFRTDHMCANTAYSLKYVWRTPRDDHDDLLVCCVETTPSCQ